ncbi:MAG: cytidylate kinase-like family protein [Tidjanibacter sp.]|nr:cytidylate kinase-like family protein [Tidjanibacter sp.]
MDKHFVITIGRQLGAGGRALAEELGRRLGVPVYNRELIGEAARQSGLSSELFERADEDENHLTLLGTGIWSFGSMINSGYINNDTLFAIQSETIERLAEQGSCIIVGRCADYVLREHEGVLSVFVTAPLEDRVERLCASCDKCEKECRQMVEQTERKRASYYNYYTFKSWGAADSYDLCLNSSLLGIEGCADVVELALKEKLK